MKLFVELGYFYSPGDEKRLFEALQSMSCLKSVRGQGLGVILDVELRKLTKTAFEDLLVLLWRYEVDIRPFGKLAERNRRFRWIAQPDRVWYRSLKDGPNRFATL